MHSVSSIAYIVVLHHTINSGKKSLTGQTTHRHDSEGTHPNRRSDESEINLIRIILPSSELCRNTIIRWKTTIINKVGIYLPRTVIYSYIFDIPS